MEKIYIQDKSKSSGVYVQTYDEYRICASDISYTLTSDIKQALIELKSMYSEWNDHGYFKTDTTKEAEYLYKDVTGNLETIINKLEG